MIDNFSNIKTKVLFVDCFGTTILRNKSKNQIFKNWAIDVSSILNIPWKYFIKHIKR